MTVATDAELLMRILHQNGVVVDGATANAQIQTWCTEAGIDGDHQVAVITYAFDHGWLAASGNWTKLTQAGWDNGNARGPKGEKRPADVIGNAVKVMRIATGEWTRLL